MNTSQIKDSVNAVVGELLEDGMKVVAVARKEMEQDEIFSSEMENEMILMGYLAFFDAPKKTAASAIARLNDLKVKTKILTGDHSQVAISICKRVGIDASRLLTGRQLDEMGSEKLNQAVEDIDVFAELSPNQKVKILRALKENGHTVGFLGDGMNDVPALCEADVGISVDTAVDASPNQKVKILRALKENGHTVGFLGDGMNDVPALCEADVGISVDTAVDAAKDAADVVLLKKDLNVLESGILEGRKTFANMLKYIRITASSNFGNIFSIVCASAFFPFLQMTSIQILLLNLLYDMICIVLPWDHVDREDYSQPKTWSGRNLTKFMCVFGPISSIFDIITFVLLYFVFCPIMCGGMMFEQISDPSVNEYFIALFQTGWFLQSMWTQVLVIHMLRTDKVPFLQSRASIPVLVVTVMGVVCFTVLTMLPAAKYLGLTAMPLWYFGYLSVIVIIYMLLTTFVKQLYSKSRYYRECK